MTISALLDGLSRRLAWSKAAGWDPVGLQLGDPTDSCHKVAVCHDVTAGVVEAATDAAVDLLVAYHPLLFKATNRLTAGGSAAGRAYAMVRRGTALAVVHTAFDVAPGGCADALAGTLGLDDVTGFGPLWPAASVKVVTFAPADIADALVAAMAAAGAGTIGDYSACAFRTPGLGSFVAGEGTRPVVGGPDAASVVEELRIEMVAPASARDRVVGALVAAHPYEEPAYDVYDVQGGAAMIGRVGNLSAPSTVAEIADLVRTALGGTVRIAGSGAVERVACIPGSGSSFIAAAAPLADVIITGDVTHHRAREAVAAGLAVVDPGHAETERPGVASLYAAVSEIAADLGVDAVDLTGIEPSPWEGP